MAQINVDYWNDMSRTYEANSIIINANEENYKDSKVTLLGKKNAVLYVLDLTTIRGIQSLDVIKRFDVNGNDYPVHYSIFLRYNYPRLFVVNDIGIEIPGRVWASEFIAKFDF